MIEVRFLFNGWDDDFGRYTAGERRKLPPDKARSLVVAGTARATRPNIETTSAPAATENTSKPGPEPKPGKGRKPK